jgi:hypothetical protein
MKRRHTRNDQRPSSLQPVPRCDEIDPQKRDAAESIQEVGSEDEARES